MDFFTFTNMFSKQFLTGVELLEIGLIDRKILTIEFHLAHIHNMVGTLYNQISLRSLFLIISPKCP